MKYLKSLVIVLALLLVGCGSEIETNMSKQVKEFEFTTQDNNSLSSET